MNTATCMVSGKQKHKSKLNPRLIQAGVNSFFYRLFEFIEKAFFGALGVFEFEAELGGEVAKFSLLVFAEGFGSINNYGHDHISPALAVNDLNSLAPEAELRAGLGACGNIEENVAVESRDSQLASD